MNKNRNELFSTHAAILALGLVALLPASLYEGGQECLAGLPLI